MANRTIAPEEVITVPYPHVATADTLLDYAALTTEFPAEDRFGPQIRMHDDLTHPTPNTTAFGPKNPPMPAFMTGSIRLIPLGFSSRCSIPRSRNTCNRATC
jgi:hypothetical protein